MLSKRSFNDVDSSAADVAKARRVEAVTVDWEYYLLNDNVLGTMIKPYLSRYIRDYPEAGNKICSISKTFRRYFESVARDIAIWKRLLKRQVNLAVKRYTAPLFHAMQIDFSVGYGHDCVCGQHTHQGISMKEMGFSDPYLIGTHLKTDPIVENEESEGHYGLAYIVVWRKICEQDMVIAWRVPNQHTRVSSDITVCNMDSSSASRFNLKMTATDYKKLQGLERNVNKIRNMWHIAPHITFEPYKNNNKKNLFRMKRNQRIGALQERCEDCKQNMNILVGHACLEEDKNHLVYLINKNPLEELEL